MNKVIALTYGRFNPPTIGHQKLFDILLRVSESKEHRIYISKTQDRAKNPLHISEKIGYLEKMFPKLNFINDETINTPIGMLESISKEGYDNLILVFGQDRLEAFQNIISKYNGKLFYFKDVRFVSSGDRNTNDNNVSSVTASKVRNLVKVGKFDEFSKFIPNLTIKDKIKLFKLLGDRMNKIPIT